MADIRVHEFMSLDGVIDNPSWTFDFGFDPRMGEAIASAMAGCRALLLGRQTYEMFAPAWSGRTAADDPGAPFFNDTPKYVVSSTLEDPSWKPVTVLGPYDPGKVAALKDELAGPAYVSGSGTLVRALLGDGLVDELHLFVYPVTLGSGPRLFTDGAPGGRWALSRSETYDNGVVYLHYRAATSADG